jgi:choice-of-anchor B domain-containing protein
MLKKLLPIIFLTAAAWSLHAQPNLNVSLVGHLQYTEDGNDIWGYVHPTTGVEYAIMGLHNGTSVVSLANPANPVEIGYAAGANSIWRDIKTWGNFAYVTTDVGTDGLVVIDLSNVPNGITFTNWQPTLTINGQTGTFEKAHNIWIDENGYGYVSGGNLGGGGVMILDLHTTPGQPIYLGATPNIYSHDCYTRGDTLFTADIYEGGFKVYDVTNKATPVLMGSHPTAFNFTHNVWLSDDSQIVFTTDEKPNAPIGAYDVSDVTNIKELDQFRPLSTAGQGVIPHNVHVWDDYLIISYYTDGLVVVDASRPANLIEVGNFDTWLNSTSGFNGAWGAYPFLPSGKILVSDINSGLYIFQPNYVRAAYLEGRVTDAATGAAIINANVQIVGILANENTDLLGDYRTGTAIAGTYTAEATAAGYMPQSVTVTLANGQLVIQDFQLTPLVPFVLNGTVQDENGAPLANAVLHLENNAYEYDLMTAPNGFFSGTVYQGNYTVTTGKWGFQTVQIDTVLNAATQNFVVQLSAGYTDEFALDLGWVATSNAQSGDWERGVPVGINDAQLGAITPSLDAPNELGAACYVTGNGGTTAGSNDVDNGTVRLTSPLFDGTGYLEPRLSLYTWFVNVGGNGTPDDALELRLSNGTTTVVLETITASNPNWVLKDYKISDFITPTSTMRLIIETSDLAGSGHILEAGVDYFRFYDGQASNTLLQKDEIAAFEVFPNPFLNHVNIRYELAQYSENTYLQITNTIGQVVDFQTISNKRGNLQVAENLNAGLYFISIIQDGQVKVTEKILKH